MGHGERWGEIFRHFRRNLELRAVAAVADSADFCDCARRARWAIEEALGMDAAGNPVHVGMAMGERRTSEDDFRRFRRSCQIW